MKVVRMLLALSIFAYCFNCIKIKNKVKYSNFLIGMSDNALESQAHTMNLKYNDLLNVFIDKNYLNDSPNNLSSKKMQKSKNQETSQNSVNLNISKDEMDIWDS